MALHYEAHGPADGDAVLLSSGLGGAAAFWQPQLRALLDAGHRVITYDHRGTGRSSTALHPAHTIADMARDVQEILDATSTPRCHLVGHALGGLIGLQLALDAPSRVASLALVNAWSRIDAHTLRCFEARIALLDACGARAYVEAQPIFLYPAAWCAAHAQRVADEVEHALAHFPGAANMHARIGALRGFDVDARLAEIAVPVLVSAAMDDVLVPWTRSRRLAQGLPNAKLELLPHGGHAHSVTEAAAFNPSLLAFLARVATPAVPA